MSALIFVPINNSPLTAAANRRVEDRLNQSGSVRFSSGEIISATFVSASGGKATLRTDDNLTFQTPSASIAGNVGDELTFEVIKRDKNGVSLKQVLPENTTQRPPAKSGMETEVKSFTKTMEMLSEDSQRFTESKQEIQAKEARAIAKIQRAQASLARNAEKSAVAALVESGVSLHKISFFALSNVMRHAEKHPSQEEGLQSLSAAGANRQAARSLHKQGLSANDRNIETLTRSFNELSRPISDASIARLIRDGGDITPEQLYKSRFSASNEKLFPEKAEHWEVPAAEILKCFVREGVADNPNNREAAKFLIDNDLPVNRDTLHTYNVLREWPRNINREDFFDRAAAYLADDKNPGDIALLALMENPESRPTRARLAEAAKSLGADMNALTTPGQMITFRRQLVEMQLKATTEAAARLSRQDIPIDTTPLQNALRLLEQLEQETHKRYLQAADAPTNEETVSQIRSLYENIEDSRALTVNVHPAIMRQQIDFSIKGISEAVAVARANAGYETFATIPNPRYGDSFNQVKPQFAPLLSNLGITPTDAHIKAAFILSKNAIDVNWENISAVKEIDAKINAVYNNLHPMIAANMLKDGLQPLQMPIDQVLSYIRQFKQDMGEDGGDKIAQYILEMDEKAVLDADTRKGMIAVYRMLHVIQKDGAAALGLALKQDAPMTLEALMDASRYYQKQKGANKGLFDAKVDDAFGHLESLTRPEGNIRDALRQSAVSYETLITDAFIDGASPDVLKDLMEEPEGTQIPLEDIIGSRGWHAAPPNEALTLTDLQAFISTPPQIIHYLQSHNIPTTLGAIRAFRRLEQKARALPDDLNDLNSMDEAMRETILEALADEHLQPLKDGETPSDLYERLLEALSDARVEADTSQSLERTEGARHLAELRNRLNDNGGFQIPLKINGRVANLSLYVLNEKAMLEDNARVFLSLDTDTLGLVEGYFTLSGNEIDLRMTAQQPEGLAVLESGKAILTAFLQEAGVTLRNLRFETANETKPEGVNTPLSEKRPLQTRTPQSKYEYFV